MCTHCTRRQFIGAGAVGGMALAMGHLTTANSASGSTPESDLKVKICVIIAGKPAGNSWGLSEEDLEPIMKRLNLAEKNLGNVEFVIGRAINAEQTTKLLEKAGPDAPVLAVSADIFGLSNFNSEDAVMPAIFKQKRPVAVFHIPIIGGHDWCLVNPWRQAGHQITLFNSSDYDDLERAASLLRVIPLLRRSRVLASPPFKGTPEAYTPEKVKQCLGVEMVAIADGRYDEVMANVDENAAKEVAKQWLDEAEGIIEPNQEDVLKAARASLTLDQLIAENRIDGLCVGTCMGWLSRGFPCLGFSRLNDRGIPAACDGDMDCLLTMLIFQHAFNRAGFLGNAGGVDTAKNAFHLSHCSAPLKMELRSVAVRLPRSIIESVKKSLSQNWYTSTHCWSSPAKSLMSRRCPKARNEAAGRNSWPRLTMRTRCWPIGVAAHSATAPWTTMRLCTASLTTATTRRASATLLT